MDFLQTVFGDEALTFAQLAERLEASQDIKLANLASGDYVGAEKYKALAGQLAQQQRDFDKELGELRFSAVLERELGAAGAQSVRAAAALLDMDALRGSDDTQAAVRQAVEGLKLSDGYLFRPPCAPAAPYADGTGAAPMMPDTYKQALGIE